ncbi:MAG: hypothetical protein K9G76_00020 [Bacteroidales bacterium]|nr:hypothetical protein [Bacteroidales bacterium]MCF8402496.1 hypothetical protein [Bacteroidales bacterium]
MKVIEKIGLGIILVLLVLPAIQKEYRLFRVPALDGDFVLAKQPSYSWASWFDGSFQSAFDTYLEENIGFRNILVRITNQLDYSLFDIPHAEGVVLCKERQLIEYDYIRTLNGGDFLGESTIDKRIRKLKFVQEHLKKEFDIDLILVFEPGKASFYPEFIPNEYLTRNNPKTNYEYFVNKAKNHEVNFIDFNQWFKQLKGNTQYPLYPRYGTHWSLYGMSIAVDSLVKYLEHVRDIDLNDMYIDSLKIQTRAKKPDYDMGAALNLLFRLPEYDTLAYPLIRFENNPNKPRPMMLTIADSYYWNIYNTGITRYLFNNEAFWYFGNLVYPEYYKNPTFATDLDLKEQVEKQNIILLMVTERFLHKFDWGFIDKLYALYGENSVYDKTYNYKANIWIYTEWIDKVIAKAENQGIPFEIILEKEANYVYHENEPENYMTFRGQKHYEEAIRADQNWLNLVRAKAEEKGLSLDETVSMEADYMFKTNFPDAYNRFQQINHYKEQLKNDSLLIEKIKDKAEGLYLTLDEMLQIEAEKMLLSE